MTFSGGSESESELVYEENSENSASTYTDLNHEDKFDYFDNLSVSSSLFVLNSYSQPISSLQDADETLCSIAIHPHFPHPAHIAIGGCDNKCRIYNISYDESILSTYNSYQNFYETSITDPNSSISYAQKIQTLEFNDTVSSIAFSNCGKFLACASYDTTIRIYTPLKSTNSNDSDTYNLIDLPLSLYTLKTTLEGPSDSIEWLQWHPRGPALLCGALDASSWLWWAPSSKVMRVFTGHASGVTLGSFGHDANTIITAGEDGTCLIFSHSGAKLHEFGYKISNNLDNENTTKQSQITSLCIHPSHPLLSIGYIDGHIRVIHTETGKVLSYFNGHKFSVESLYFFSSKQGPFFGPHDTLISAGLDGLLIFWDTSRLVMRGQIDITPFLLPHLTIPESGETPGITKIEFLNPSLPILLIATTSGQICIIDCQDYSCRQILNAHLGPILDIRTVFICRNIAHIVSAGEDGLAAVWEIDLKQILPNLFI